MSARVHNAVMSRTAVVLWCMHNDVGSYFAKVHNLDYGTLKICWYQMCWYIMAVVLCISTNPIYILNNMHLCFVFQWGSPNKPTAAEGQSTDGHLKSSSRIILENLYWRNDNSPQRPYFCLYFPLLLYLKD